MKISKVSYRDTQAFSELFLDYLEKKELLEPFYELYPSLESFGKQIKNRNFPDKLRQDLSETIKEQYKEISLSQKV
ncbi:MAG: bacillithiol biosynthesis BshC, partial [Cytophagaceae bacterium]